VLTGVIALIVLAGFIDVTSSHDSVGIDTDTFTSARLGKGMLLSDLDTLDNQMEFAREVRDLTVTHDDIRRPAVVIVGFIYPELAVLYKDELEFGVLERDLEAISQLSDKGRACDPDCNDPQIEYVWLLDYDTFQFYKESGAALYYTADAARSTFSVYGYRPGYFGALELPLSRDNPSLGAGTADTDR
jgi:hypothetical protein